MFKLEDIQNYGQEQCETAVAHTTSLQNGLSAIVSEDTKSLAEKLSGVKSLDKALEAQGDYTKVARNLRRRLAEDC